MSSSPQPDETKTQSFEIDHPVHSSQSLTYLDSPIHPRADVPDRESHLCDALNHCYFELAPLLSGLSRRQRRGLVEPEDASQEAWLAILSEVGKDRFHGDRDRFLAWSAVVVHHRLTNLERRAARRLHASLGTGQIDALVGRETDPAEEYERRRVRAIVQAVLAEARGRLPEIAHRILILRWIEGRTVDEIGSILGLTATRVRDRHRRAVPILRGLLERRFGPEWIVRKSLDDRRPGLGEVTP